MTIPTRTRVMPTGPNNGYGPGRWLAQYFDADMKLWFDIGDPHDTEAEALKAAADHGEQHPAKQYLPSPKQEAAEAWADQMLKDGTYPPETPRDDLIAYYFESHQDFEDHIARDAQMTPEEEFMGGPDGPAGAMGYQGRRR